jgi:hypothetical protein
LKRLNGGVFFGAAGLGSSAADADPANSDVKRAPARQVRAMLERRRQT